MVVVLGLFISLVPIMRFKDYLSNEGIKLQELFSKVKSFDFSCLSQVSWSRVWSYLKGFVRESNSCAGFEKFQVEDSQDQSPIINLIEDALGIVWESY